MALTASKPARWADDLSDSEDKQTESGSAFSSAPPCPSATASMASPCSSAMPSPYAFAMPSPHPSATPYPHPSAQVGSVRKPRRGHRGGQQTENRLRARELRSAKRSAKRSVKRRSRSANRSEDRLTLSEKTISEKKTFWEFESYDLTSTLRRSLSCSALDERAMLRKSTILNRSELKEGAIHY